MESRHRTNSNRAPNKRGSSEPANPAKQISETDDAFVVVDMSDKKVVDGDDSSSLCLFTPTGTTSPTNGVHTAKEPSTPSI